MLGPIPKGSVDMFSRTEKLEAEKGTASAGDAKVVGSWPYELPPYKYRCNTFHSFLSQGGQEM